MVSIVTETGKVNCELLKSCDFNSECELNAKGRNKLILFLSISLNIPSLKGNIAHLH